MLKVGGVIELNKMPVIEVKLDALMSKINNPEKINHSVNKVGIVEGAEHKQTNQGLALEGPYQVEEPQYIQSNWIYNLNPNNNLPTHYTPAFRNHENLSYGVGVQHGPIPMQNIQ